MASPYFFAALSIIPGLGLIALREFRKGVISFIIIISLGFWFIGSDSEFIEDVSAIALWALWTGQIVYTYQLAKRKTAMESRESEIKPLEKIVFPPNLSGKEKGRYRNHEQIQQQLNAGETLKGGMMGFWHYKYLPFLMKQFLIGLTDRNLVIISLDLMGKPLDISRYAYNDIEHFEISKSVFISKAQFWFVNKKRPMKLNIPNRFHLDDLELLKKTFSHVTK